MGDFYMIDELLTMNQVSKMLHVSMQTLRNWDENGYLRAKRTQGLHRRYSKSDIENFISGKNEIPFHSCWEIDHYNHCEKINKELGSRHPLAKACGGFTKEQIGQLLNNQDTAHDQDTLSLTEKYFFEVAEGLSSPYLFPTYVMPHCTSMVTYMRVRGKVVCESESVCASTYKGEYGLTFDGFDLSLSHMLDLVKMVDIANIENILDNRHPKTAILSDFKNIDKNIVKAKNLIDETTSTKEHKVVIMPPELCSNRNLIKLNDNLKKVDDPENEIYVSRLLPDDNIIVGVKSKSKFNGYAFCPYMLTCHIKSKNHIFMRVGNRLIRSGAGYYSVITVK